ncbi:MAG: acyltransferase family protein [Gammaproteobacteria bacterium]|jgi:peptidoglycan/LPS O-acetylase OafA/YrhL
MLSSYPKHPTQYRPDIDGLRAVAVLSVILFHLDETLVPGGFVGVDVFFVISGYLITLHILRDMDAGRFSLLEFYRRRVKRIAPVMLVVVAAVLLVSMVILRPEDTDNVGRTAFAALLSMANVYFWLFEDSDYFAQASTELPLLHLWSLGVEEQFYIFWPLILMTTYQATRGRHFLGVFSLVAAGSFILGQFLFPAQPSFVYYMLPTRAGELLLGALSAYLVTKKGDLVVPAWLISLAAVSGMLMIAASMAFLTEAVVFPGLYAIPPTLGTAALILAGHYGDSLPVRMMTFRPLVFVGLISYSAYLWHWPLLAFSRYAGISIDLSTGSAFFMLTLLLSTLTYYWVERPTRRYQGTAVQVIVNQYIIPAGALLALSLAIVGTRGYFLHYNADQYGALQVITKPAYAYDYICQKWELTDEDLKNDACVLGKPDNTQPSVLLWGDSHAAHYVGMLGAFAEEAGFRFRNLQHSACPPISSDPADYVPARLVEKCQRSLERVLSVIDDYKVIVISSAWIAYERRSDRFFDDFFMMVRDLVGRGKKVILLGEVPHVNAYDRVCAEKAVTLTWLQCDYADNLLSSDIAAANARLKAFSVETAGVDYYDIVDHLCPGGLCSAYDEAWNALYYDSTHLSLPASWEIGRRIIARAQLVPPPFAAIVQ